MTPALADRRAASPVGVLDLGRMQAALDRDLPNALRTLAAMLEAGTLAGGRADLHASAMTQSNRVRVDIALRCDGPVLLAVTA